jgi:hypothetical protein
MTNKKIDKLIYAEKDMWKKVNIFRRFYRRSGWKAFWLQFGDWDIANKEMVKKFWSRKYNFYNSIDRII